MNAELDRFFTLSNLARRADCAPQTVKARITKGELKPDALTAQGHYLFRADRLDEIKKIVASNATEVVALNELEVAI